MSNLSKWGKPGKTLEHAIKSKRLTHFYIVDGGTQSERRAFSLSFFKALGCEHFDELDELDDLDELDELDDENRCNCVWCRKIDSGNMEDFYDIRRQEKARDLTVAESNFISSAVQTAPINAVGKNLVLINEGQYLNLAAANKLLKTLEEPMSQSLIVMTLDGIDSVLDTIRSRAVVLSLPNHGFDSSFREGNELCNSSDYSGDDTLNAIDINDVERLMSMVQDGEPFHRVCQFMEAFVNSTGKAMELLEKFKELSIASQVGLVQTKIKSPMLWIDASQEALEKLAYNVEYMYAVKACLLKIGGIDDNSSWS